MRYVKRKLKKNITIQNALYIKRGKKVVNDQYLTLPSYIVMKWLNFFIFNQIFRFQALRNEKNLIRNVTPAIRKFKFNQNSSLSVNSNTHVWTKKILIHEKVCQNIS